MILPAISIQFNSLELIQLSNSVIRALNSGPTLTSSTRFCELAKANESKNDKSNSCLIISLVLNTYQSLYNCFSNHTGNVFYFQFLHNTCSMRFYGFF